MKSNCSYVMYPAIKYVKVPQQIQRVGEVSYKLEMNYEHLSISFTTHDVD